MIHDRASVKLIQLLRTRAPYRSARDILKRLDSGIKSKCQGGPLNSLSTNASETDVLGSCLEGYASPAVSSSLASHQCQCSLGAPAQQPFTRQFGCSPGPTYELDEAFDAEPFKFVRNYSQHSISENNSTRKTSVRIEAPKAGILDKEVLRKRRTQPFTEKCWMQSLGVGLYRDKLKNRRSLHCTAEPPDGSCSPNTSAASGGTAKEIQMQKQNSFMAGKKAQPAEGALEHGAPPEDTGETDEEGFDTDSDDEPDDCANCSPSMTAKMKEESVEALEASLRDLEASKGADEHRVGATCLRLAQLCDSSEEDPLKVLMYGERALKLLKPPEISIDRAMCLQVIGAAHYKLDDSDKAVPLLEEAAAILEKVGASVKGQELARLKYAVQVYLGLSKMSLGKKAEALVHYQEGIAINERTLEPGNPDLAKSYLQAAEAYMEDENHKESLSLCMKALPIYLNYYGSSSYQVASLRRLISVIHNDLEDYNKVLDEHEIIRPILKSLGKFKEVASLDLASGEALLSLGKYKEAIDKLKDVTNEAKEASRFHGHALVLIGKAYAAIKEGKNAVKYCKKAYDVLKTKKYSLEAATSLKELAATFEQLNELEQAVAVLKSALEIFQRYPEHPQPAADVEGQIGLLYIFVGKVNDGLPYLEKAAAKIQDIYGPQSSELLAIYNHIAMANLELGEFCKALTKLEPATRIATELYGPDDPKTVRIYNHLVTVYSGLDRVDKAIEYQQLIVASSKKSGTNVGITVEQAEHKLKLLMQQSISTQERKYA